MEVLEALSQALYACKGCVHNTKGKGKGIDSHYSALLYLRVLCNQIAHLDRRRKIDQMNKLETLDHTALRLYGKVTPKWVRLTNTQYFKRCIPRWFPPIKGQLLEEIIRNIVECGITYYPSLMPLGTGIITAEIHIEASCL